MKRRIIYTYGSINMDAISCFDLEAKLERERLNSPRFWRLYYTAQEVLARDFLYLYNNGADGGIRQQSTLPPKLNREAMEIATKVYYDTK